MAQALKVGSKIPHFQLPDQNGEPFDIDQLIGEKSMVIYFYPKDETPGCTKEACSFRDHYEDFQDLGAEVIGISSDDIQSHKAFAAKHNLPFTLLSDEKKEVRKLFGVPTNLLGFLPGRVTYIVNKDGVVINMFNSQTNIQKHVQESLQSIKAEVN